MQLREVARAALGEIAVRLGRDADRDRGQLHQVGVGGLLPTQDHYRDARAEHGGEPGLPGSSGAENADHHQVGAVEQFGQIRLDVESGRVA